MAAGSAIPAPISPGDQKTLAAVAVTFDLTDEGCARGRGATMMAPMSNRPIYMDFQATTPTDVRVFETMAPYFVGQFGNPHATENLFGQAAAAALDGARAQVADSIGADPREIIFTSGATEANNLVLQGIARRMFPLGKRHLVTCATEHKSVLEVMEELRLEGFEVTILPVRSDGLLDPDDLAAAIRPETALVSVMAANNEIGVVQPLDTIARVCRDHAVLFHSDAAQAIGKVPLDVRDFAVDYLSISGHKLYGPMGVGAVYMRRTQRTKPRPLFRGGGQEGGIRPGTVALPLCVGLGAACELASAERDEEAKRLLRLRTRLLDALKSADIAFAVNGSVEHRLPGNLNLSFAGVDAEALLMTVRSELAIASGSACTAGALEASHVVSALGFGPDRAEGAIRIGLGRTTTDAEVEAAANCLIAAASRLQRVAYSPAAGVGALN